MKRVSRLTALTLVLAGSIGSSADALRWSTPRELPGRSTDATDNDDAPPVAINRRGDVVVSWIGERFRTAVAVGNRRRGFSKPAYVPAADTPTVAIAPKGGAIVGWTDESPDLEYTPAYGILSPRGELGRTHQIDKAGVWGAPRLTALPDGSFVAVYVARDRRRRHSLRTLRISPSGKPGRRTTLGRPSDGEEFELASAPGGQLIVCCRKEPGRRIGVWTFSPGGGWSTVSITLGVHERFQSISTAGGVFLLVTDDAGTSTFRLLRGDSATRIEVPVPPRSAHSGELDARGRILVGYRDGERSYRRILRTDGSAVGDAVEVNPDDLPWARGVWRAGLLYAGAWNDRWRVVTEQDGIFAVAPAPSGPVYFSALATAGDAVALSWYDYHHHAYVSIGRP